ncbi:Rotatin, partial [Trichoplax sp. H2]
DTVYCPLRLQSPQATIETTDDNRSFPFNASFMDSHPVLEDVQLTPLIEKLVHPLQEVRLRALKNLHFKLENGFILIEDLLHERQLVVNLLQWFNVQSTSLLAKENLILLEKLSQHDPGIDTLKSIGAVEFLNQLKLEIGIQFHQVIDNILHNISSRVCSQPNLSVREPNPRSHNQADVKNNQKFIHHGPRLPDATGMLTTVNLPKQLYKVAKEDKLPDSKNRSTISAPLLVNDSFHESFTQETQHFEPRDINRANFMKKRSNELVIITFPWIHLYSSDEHVLATTHSRLRSRDPSLADKSCQFLSDVLFKDFPAEIFIQRPAIITDLLDLTQALSSQAKTLPVQSVRCLKELCVYLVQRIGFYRSTSTYQAYGGAGHTVSNSRSVISKSMSSRDSPSDGEDGSCISSFTNITSEISEYRNKGDIDDNCGRSLQHLRSRQWTLPYFCTMVMTHTIPLLKGFVGYSGWINVPSQEVLSLLYDISRIIDLSMPDELWTDNSIIKNVADDLLRVFDMFAEVLQFYYHLIYDEVDESQGHTNQRHELEDNVVMWANIGALAVRIVDRTVPVELANRVIPSSMKTIFSLLCMEYGFNSLYPDYVTTVRKFLSACDTKAYEIYCDFSHILRSFHAASMVIHTKKEFDEQFFISALESLPGLFYHDSASLLRVLVHSIMDVHSRDCNKSSVSLSRNLLLKLLSHPLSDVRKNTYRCCTEIVKVSASAREIMITFFQGRYLMPETMWSDYLSNIHDLFPFIQGYACRDSKFTDCLLSVIENSGVKLVNTSHQMHENVFKIRGYLRSLFCTDESLREMASNKIRNVLEADSLFGRENFQTLNLTETDLPHFKDLFEVDESDDEVFSESSIQSIFQADSVLQLWSIITSKETEISLKKLALEQLATSLTDSYICDLLINRNATEDIVNIIMEGQERSDTENSMETVVLLPFALKALHRLLRWDEKNRLRMAYDYDAYRMLLRCIIASEKSSSSYLNAVHALVYLLFDEVSPSRVSVWISDDSEKHKIRDFRFPRRLSSRMSLLARYPTYECKNPYKVQQLSYAENLYSEPSQTSLKLGWSIYVANNVEDLIKKPQAIETDKLSAIPGSNLCDESLPYSRLARKDNCILLASHPNYRIDSLLSDIENAVSHHEVLYKLSKISKYLRLNWNLGIESASSTVIDFDSNSFGDSANTRKLLKVKWFKSFSRFLSVPPSSTDDQNLLAAFFNFIAMLIKNSPQVYCSDLVNDAVHYLIDPKMLCVKILKTMNNFIDTDPNFKGEHNIDTNRRLYKELLGFINITLQYLPSESWSIRQAQCGELASVLITKLEIGNSLNFYDLWPIQMILDCLIHILARPCWSSGCNTMEPFPLCVKLLASLLQIIVSFHGEYGQFVYSFMGKGVTRRVALCLRHLMHEMQQLMPDTDITSYWLCFETKEERYGLSWIYSLWSDHDALVRWCGLGIATDLVLQPEGLKLLDACCQHIDGGIWNVLLTLLHDSSECNIIKCQAAAMLTSLLTATDSDPCSYLNIIDEELKATKRGLSALLMLLDRINFYQTTITIIKNVNVVAEINKNCCQEMPPDSNFNIASGIDKTVSSGCDGDFKEILSQNWYWSKVHVVADVPTNSKFIYEICRLMAKLVVLCPSTIVKALYNEGVLYQLAKLLETSGLDEQLKLLKNRMYREFYEIRTIIQMSSEIIKLFTLVCNIDPSIGCYFIKRRMIVSSLFRFLSDNAQEEVALCRDCYCFWQTIFQFFSTVLSVDSQENYDCALEIFKNNWILFNNAVVTILSSEKSTNSQRNSALNLLCIILAREGKYHYEHSNANTASFTSQIIELLEMGEDEPNERKNDEIGNSKDDALSHQSYSIQLCHLLLDCYEGANVRCLTLTDKIPLMSALKLILACSPRAKYFALQSGFLDSIIDRLKQLRAQLSISFLSATNKFEARNKVQGNLLLEISQILNICRGLMYRDDSTKNAALLCGLTEVLYRLWPWCFVESSFMSSVLAIMCTYTADFEKAAKSFAINFTGKEYTSIETNEVNSSSSSSLVYNILKFLMQSNWKKMNTPLTSSNESALFALISNLSSSAECRSIMWKANFLQALHPQNVTKQFMKHNVAHLRLWYKILANLSFSRDGQQMMMKVEGIIHDLCCMTTSSEFTLRKNALLVLRNMCFNSTLKAHFWANDDVLQCFSKTLVAESDVMKEIAISALLAMIYNCQKAKLAVKRLGILDNLDNIIASEKDSGKNDAVLIRNASALLDTLRIGY